MLNEDYRDILRALSQEKAEFLLVGAYALAIYGYPRSTMDIDLWIMPSPTNALSVLRALIQFGAPVQNLTSDDLAKEQIIFQIGVAPRRIDILTSVDGLDFASSFQRSNRIAIDGIDVHVLSIEDLIQNKKTAGRLKDLADVEALEILLARNSKKT